MLCLSLLECLKNDSKKYKFPNMRHKLFESCDHTKSRCITLNLLRELMIKNRFFCAFSSLILPWIESICHVLMSNEVVLNSVKVTDEVAD